MTDSTNIECLSHIMLLTNKKLKYQSVCVHENVQLQFLLKKMFQDACCRTSDKYLIAMVLVYFKKSGLSKDDYTRLFS